jgi:hypothetical protein
MGLIGLVGSTVALVLASPPPACVEPYPLLHGNDPKGNPAVPQSPDPLVSTTWSTGEKEFGNQWNLQCTNGYEGLPLNRTILRGCLPFRAAVDRIHPHQVQTSPDCSDTRRRFLTLGWLVNHKTEHLNFVLISCSSSRSCIRTWWSMQCQQSA